ncbi:hypothetical protein HOLleu_00027 [Holothuria leucospilota]|uniref:Peptidase aspartic putative domain-containing protein n=1 Tax=Holothuria leucospilota TaxID=206669 RepID=A0A9Q1HJZ2_HOLLE|nr:hypothetical protein HOLleu_00027 [Holothuria leucospilota]
MTSRALASAVQTGVLELDRLWRKIRKELRDLASKKYIARSKGSNASSILKAQAIAAASAANESAVFEEIIAQRTLEYKTQKAVQELERVKQEAAAEADLKILRARQTAAVEKARTEAILQVQKEDYKVIHTSPNQTSNDHAYKFLSSRADEDTHSEIRAHTPLIVNNEGVPNDSKPNKNPFSQVPVCNSSPILPQRYTTEEKLIDLTRQITNTLAQQRQPIHEPDVFKGDPLLFHPWRSSFEAMIGQACTSPIQKLTYLAKYTDGKVKELVDRYRHRYTAEPETAYRELWVELERRFGNQSNVTSEIIRRIQSFPKIGPSNRKELQTLSDLCCDAAAQMAYLPGLSILNYPQTMYPILDKLPEHVHNSWRKEVSNNKLNYGTYPTFSQFTKFLTVKARMYNDPDLYPCDDIPKPPEPIKTPPSVTSTSKVTPSTSEQFCHFHKQQGHNTSECVALGRQSVEERREFCKTHGLCFKCGQNHLARDCDTEVKCKRCDSNRHASFMHSNERQEREMENQDAREVQAPQTEEKNIKCTKFSTCSTARSCSKIVLVKLYHESNPTNWMHAYVVLDDQSNACLGDPKLFEKLKINGPDHEYKLSTCGGSRVAAKGRRASGLIIESLNGHKEKLPTIIENGNIPGDRKEIPTPDICQAYPHLRGISEYIFQPRDDVDIILLIGRNCPEPLKVRESRNGPRGTPWAQRTDLGWTVSGQVCTSGAGRLVHATVNRTILESCDDPLGMSCDSHIYAKDIVSPKHMEDVYVERIDDEARALSVEDRQFMKLMSDAACTNALGNLEFPLPFKIGKRALPNNFHQARSRLKNLVKTLRRKPDVMKDYLMLWTKLFQEAMLQKPVNTKHLQMRFGTCLILQFTTQRNLV